MNIETRTVTYFVDFKTCSINFVPHLQHNLHNERSYWRQYQILVFLPQMKVYSKGHLKASDHVIWKNLLIAKYSSRIPYSKIVRPSMFSALIIVLVVVILVVVFFFVFLIIHKDQVFIVPNNICRPRLCRRFFLSVSPWRILDIAPSSLTWFVS